MLLGMLWISGQWVGTLLEDANTRYYQREILLLGDIARSDYLKGNFEGVEEGLTRWSWDHRDIHSLKLTTENGFVLVDFQRGGDREEGSDLQAYRQKINFLGDFLFTLEIEVDDHGNQLQIQHSQLKALAVLLIFLLLIAYVVWRSTHNIVLQPLDRELQKKVEELQAAQKIKDEFLATMSHELRTPLASILGYSELLLDEPSSPEQRAYMQAIRSAGENQLALVNDILDMSKIEAGKFTVNDAPFSLSKLLTDIRKMFEVRVRDIGLTFIVEQKYKEEMLLWGDSLRVMQVLVNLIGNATKFTEKGSVTLTTDVVYGQLQFSVTDTGIGIKPENMERLFKRFEQEDGSISRRFGGTGLGLFISQNLAELMGGSLSAHSTYGEGSTFILQLPYRPTDEPEEIVEPESRDTTIHDGLYSGHVLVVEDTLAIQLLVKRMLERNGLSVSIAENGQEGIEMSANETFDLILMDMQMPVMDGLEATRLIKQAGSPTPIIALTANVMEAHRKAFEEAGCDGFLSKPIDRDVLLGLIDRYLKPLHVHEIPDDDRLGSLRRAAIQVIQKEERAVGHEEMGRAALLEELQIHEVALEMQSQQLLEHEQQQMKQVRQYQKMFEHSPVATLLMTERGKIEQVNRAARQLLGIHQLKQDNNQISHYLSQLKTLTEINHSLMDKAETLWSGQTEMMADDGVYHQVQLTASITEELSPDGDRPVIILTLCV